MTWAIGYIVLSVEGAICLYACHQQPHGVRNTWRALWRQLRHRPPRLPAARALR